MEKDHQALENVPRRRRGRRERREKDKAKREERRERREKDRHRHTRSEQGAAGGGGGSSGNEMDGTDGLRSDTMGSLPVDTTSCTPRMPQVPLSHRGPLRDNVSEREPLTHRSRPMTMESNMTGGGGSIPALRREAEREVAEMEGRGGRDYRGGKTPLNVIFLGLIIEDSYRCCWRGVSLPSGAWETQHIRICLQGASSTYAHDIITDGRRRGRGAR